MADLTITAANVLPTATTVLVASGLSAIAGEALTAGQAVYQAADTKWYKAKANGTALQARALGVVLHSAAAGQPITVGSGLITIGATTVQAKKYCVSETAGGICPIADLTTTADYISELGIAPNATQINFVPNPTGVQVP